MGINFRTKWANELPKIVKDSDVNSEWTAFTNYIADIEQSDIDVVLKTLYYLMHVERCPSTYLSNLAKLLNADLSGAADDNAKRVILSNAFKANLESLTTQGFSAILKNIAIGAEPQIISHWQVGYWLFVGDNARSLVDNLMPANVRADDQFNKGGLSFTGSIAAHNLVLVLIDAQTEAVYDKIRDKIKEIKAAHHIHWLVTPATGGGYIRQREIV